MDSEEIGQQSVTNVARKVKEAKAMMARDMARKASQERGKLLMAKEEAKVAKDQHAKHSKGMAITAGNGVTWRRIASFWRSPRAQVKARVQAVSKKLRRVDQKTLQLVDLACAHSKTRVMAGGGTIVAR